MDSIDRLAHIFLHPESASKKEIHEVIQHLSKYTTANDEGSGPGLTRESRKEERWSCKEGGEHPGIDHEQIKEGSLPAVQKVKSLVG